jgi:hypothetical protein
MKTQHARRLPLTRLLEVGGVLTTRIVRDPIPNCTDWPADDYVEQDAKPTIGELDNQFRSKEAAGNCTSG